MFADRSEVGRLLAEVLAAYREEPDLRILAIPRGGIPVGFELAKALRAPLGVWLTRKIGAPGNPELALGAVSADGHSYLDHALIANLAVSQSYLEQEIARQRAVLEARKHRYLKGEPLPDLTDKVVIVTDDGIATGATAAATLRSVGAHEPRKIVLAVPVASPEAVRRLTNLADELVVLDTPDPFHAVGRFYRRFEQVGDDEVLALLAAAEQRSRP